MTGRRWRIPNRCRWRYAPFNRSLPQANQIARQRDDVNVTADELLAVPPGTITTEGLRSNLRIGIQYQADGPGDEGLKSVTIFDLMVLPQSWGRVAFGPVMSLAESASSAESKFSIGPARGSMRLISKKLNMGLFNQNLFDTSVGITQIQPIVAYQLGHGWALSAGDLQFTYDWELDQWVLLPLGFQIGVVRPLGGQPLRFALNPQYNFKDILGAEQFKLTFTVPVLAPAR